MPSTRITRRRLVAAGGLAVAAALSGCSESSAPESTPRQLSLSLSPLDGPLRDRFVVDLDGTPPPWDEAAFEAALEGRNHTTQHHPPFVVDDERLYTRRNGTYYHLDSLVVGEEAVTRPVLRLYEVEDPDSLEADPVSADALPQVDDSAIRVAWFAARARGNPGGVPYARAEVDGYVYRREEAIADSAILGDAPPTHVTYRDDVYEVDVSRERFHEAVYRPDVDPVADSAGEMETILRAEHLDARLGPEELPAPARSILREAIREPYRESYPYSEAYGTVLEALGFWAYLDGDVESDAGIGTGVQHGYLAYDGRYYGYTLQFVGGE